MRTSVKYWSALLLLSFGLSACSNYYFERATMEYDNLQYSKAIKDFDKAVGGKYQLEAKIGLANSFMKMGDLKSAKPLFEEIISSEKSNPLHMLDYAKILISEKDYDEAKKWLNNYLAKVPGDKVAEDLLLSCNSTKSFVRDTTLFTVDQIEYEGFASSFGQVPYVDGVIFSADKFVSSNSKKDPWTGKGFYDLYYAKKEEDGHWAEPIPLTGDVNGKYHEGPAVFTKDGKTAYFTRSNYTKRKLEKSSNDENNLKIFTAKLKDGKWIDLQELPFNDDEYSVGHPALSLDEETLYFVSDMPGGFGGTDVYSSVLNGTEWSKPENLGSTVNTSSNEMFPSVASNGKLYFSSEAHINMGGLDVFSTSFDEKNNAWSPVEVFMYPLNSEYDDFSFLLLDDHKSGYISSNRTSTDRIYEFEIHDPTFKVEGVVVDKDTKQPIEGALITLTNKSDNSQTTTQTDYKGAYSIAAAYNFDFEISAERDNYLKRSADVSTKNKIYSETLERNFELDALIIEKPIVVENIYYDYDKWNIRPDAAVELDKLVRTLNDNPDIDIELGSHADARGTHPYNDRLTAKRANTDWNQRYRFVGWILHRNYY